MLKANPGTCSVHGFRLSYRHSNAWFVSRWLLTPFIAGSTLQYSQSFADLIHSFKPEHWCSLEYFADASLDSSLHNSSDAEKVSWWQATPLSSYDRYPHLTLLKLKENQTTLLFPAESSWYFINMSTYNIHVHTIHSAGIAFLLQGDTCAWSS